MSENTLQLIAGLKLLLVAGFAVLYGYGGVSGKWKRRLIAPALYGAGIMGFTLWTKSVNYWLLLVVPLLSFALTLGYGATNTTTKIKRRAIAGLAAGVASLPVFWVTGAWTLLALHIGVCVATSIVAGVWNQTQSARAEETLIGAMYVMVPLLTI